ncbi:hypothetical protein [Hyphomicrobium sp. CS1BSMeth3]|uniref:hypothetical protein n=1 Tax=Hyphomicrobium sp. CS1BSMeth3 TaxID=1892844 RepID=UPI0009308BBC|nr:hypothetical protein [Hyphomicrobium sp. CS1BSMeth3]
MGWRDDPVIEETNASPPSWENDPVISEMPQIDFNRSTGAIRKDIAKLPEAQRDAALKAWADFHVARERKGARSAFDRGTDYLRDMATGTPVGSWLNEANAATSAAVHWFTGERMGAPYDESMAYQEARDRAVDKDATKVGKIPFTNIDVNTSDLRKVAGGIASAPVSPIAHVFRGAAVLPQMGNAAITGLGYGALYGAGQGEGVKERLIEGGKGAGIGVALGPAAVGAARMVGNAAGHVAERMRPLPPALRGYDRGAVDRVARAVGDDDLAARYQQQAADLGPEGMLADMGPNLRGQASAIANQPGTGQRVVSDALNARRDGAAGRITADVDQALGPAANIPETVHATQQHYRAQAAPHRQQFQNNPVPFTRDLEDTLTLLAQNEPAVIREARRYANIDPAAGPNQFFARQRPDGSFEITRVPNATEYDYLKRSLDGMGGRTATANDQRIYGNLARRLRTQVDEAISPGAPDQSPWAQARRLEAEDFQIRDAMDQGRSALVGRSMTPDEMSAAMFGVGNPPRGGMTPPEAAGYLVGAREGVRNVMGHASTAQGENSAAAARRALGSDFAREKLDLVAGPQAAGRLTRRLDAETTFDQTRQAVLGNSATAGRLTAQGEFPNAAGRSDLTRGWGNRSLPGMVAEGGIRLANLLSGQAISERNVRLARDAAEMLIAQGHTRDNMANALLALSQRRQLNSASRARLARLAVQIAEGGGRPVAIEKAKAKRPAPQSPWPSHMNRALLSLPPPQ